MFRIQPLSLLLVCALTLGACKRIEQAADAPAVPANAPVEANVPSDAAAPTEAVPAVVEQAADAPAEPADAPIEANVPSDAAAPTEAVPAAVEESGDAAALGLTGGDVLPPSGTFTLSEICTSGTDTYTVIVSPKTGTNEEANIQGLWSEPKFTAVAKINADGLGFVIERTPFSTDSVTFEIESANGTINAAGTTITLTYTIYDGTTTVDQCVANLTKQ